MYCKKIYLKFGFSDSLWSNRSFMNILFTLNWYPSLLRAVSNIIFDCAHIEFHYLESHFHHYIPFPVSISMCMLKKCFSLFIGHVSPTSYSYSYWYSRLAVPHIFIQTWWQQRTPNSAGLTLDFGFSSVEKKTMQALRQSATSSFRRSLSRWRSVANQVFVAHFQILDIEGSTNLSF